MHIGQEAQKKNKREEDRLQYRLTGESKRQVEDTENERHIGQSHEHSYQQRDRNGTGSHRCKQ